MITSGEFDHPIEIEGLRLCACANFCAASCAPDAAGTVRVMFTDAGGSGGRIEAR